MERETEDRDEERWPETRKERKRNGRRWQRDCPWPEKSRRCVERQWHLAALAVAQSVRYRVFVCLFVVSTVIVFNATAALGRARPLVTAAAVSPIKSQRLRFPVTNAIRIDGLDCFFSFSPGWLVSPLFFVVYWLCLPTHFGCWRTAFHQH